MGKMRVFLAWVALIPFLAAGAPAASPAPAMAPARIAVIDLERVFRDYYRSKIAEDAIRQQAEVYRTYLLRLNTELQKLQEEAQKARLASQNIALSEEDRAKEARTAGEKTREVAEKKAEIELYATGRAEDMRRIEQEKRQEIMAEIHAEIRRRATAEGYSFVLDRSGKTMNEQPAVLFYPADDDLTEAVLTALNRTRTRPAPPSRAPEAAPKTETNP